MMDEEDSITQSVATFIRDLYRGILRRDADPDGLAHHIRLLGEFPSFADGAKVLSSFVDGQESRSLQTFRLPMPEDNIFVDHVISLGSYCLTSYTLKTLGYKNWSGPFDWIFSNIGMATHCINDDFKTFLNREFHVRVPEDEKMFKDANFCDHMFYLQEYNVKYIFNHTDITFENEYKYYVRCVERFRDVMRSADRKLLVLVSYNVDTAEFFRLCGALSVFPRTKLLVVRIVASGGHRFGATLLETHGDSVLYEMNLIDVTGPVAFRNGVDDGIFKYLVTKHMAESH